VRLDSMEKLLGECRGIADLRATWQQGERGV